MNVTKLSALALGIAAIGLSACGSSKDDSSGAAAAAAAKPATSTTAASSSSFDAEGLGQQAAEKAGGSVALPQRTIGFLNIIHAVESAQRAEAAFTEAGRALGFKVLSCDGQGDPTKIAGCADTLLNQGAQAIATNGVEAAQIKSALARAKAKKIPVVECTSSVTPSTLFSGEYGPDDSAAGALAAKYVVDQLGQQSGDKTIAIHSFPTGFASLRTASLKAALKDHPDIKVVDEVSTDLADPAGSTQKAVAAELTQYPKLSAIWVAFDIAVPGAAQAVFEKYGRADVPKRPLVVGFNANTASLQWMKRGALDALSDTAFENTCWAAADQFAEYFARGTKPAQGPGGKTFLPDYGFAYADPQLVTKDNIPGKPASDSVDPLPQPTDAPAFFRAKWKAEFGK
jgi:ABC-type sugar transport system substrate-binding protein